MSEYIFGYAFHVNVLTKNCVKRKGDTLNYSWCLALMGLMTAGDEGMWGVMGVEMKE